MLWTTIGFCSAYGVSSCPLCDLVLTATSMHTKPHLLNARARGQHCVYVSLVLQYLWMARKIESLHSNAQDVVTHCKWPVNYFLIRHCSAKVPLKIKQHKFQLLVGTVHVPSCRLQSISQISTKNFG